MTNGNASGTDGIEISKREPYFDERTGKEGLYTQRIYRVSECASLIPLLLPLPLQVPAPLDLGLPPLISFDLL